MASRSKNGLLLHNAPSLTIEAQYNRPVRVKWINDLKHADGNFRPHLLPVDPTLHWANPPGGAAGRDTRPTFTATPGPYTGPIPIVTHVHGAVGVGDESDGYAEAWFLPAAGNIPAGHATQGTWYDFFKGKAVHHGGLMSHGSIPDNLKLAGEYVAKILKGAKPGDLPVEQPNRYYLVVSEKAALLHGLSFPNSLLVRADEVLR